MPLRRRARSLRFRLAFWNTAVILLLVGGTLVGIREGLRYTLLRELDGQLTEDALEVALMLDEYSDSPRQLQEEFDRKAISHDRHRWFVHVYRGEELLFASAGSPPPEPGPLAADARPHTAGDFRVVTRDYRGPEPARVAVGASLRPIRENLARLTELILLVGLGLAVVIPLSGYWLAGRATRPLAAMISTAARLHPERLEERLPARGTGDELDELARMINGFLDVFGDYLRRKRDFLANAAHELRSPLAALRTNIEVALQQERTPEEYAEVLGALAEETAALTVLVNQLLLLAEEEAGRLRPGGAVQRLDRLAAKSVEMFRGVAEQRGVKLREELAGPVTTPGEAAHLRQLLHNLIDNALKFTPPGGVVTVRARPEPSEGAAVLEVADTGCGIPPEDLPRIFERFYRADRSRLRGPEGGGTGLGLSICEAIVRAYHGDIHVDSTPGRGTCVRVRLPSA